jgi:drug/metabolite transporter (DMT)-like permease
MNAERDGILLKLASGLMFVAMGTIIKAVGRHVPIGEVVFFRGAVAGIVLTIGLFARGELRQLATQQPWPHVRRGIIGSSALICTFLSFRYLALAEAQALTYLTPMLTVAFASLTLGERITVARRFALIGGLGGVITILAPQFASTSPNGYLGLGFGLAACILTAVSAVQIRKLTETETAGAIVFYFTISLTLLSILSAPFGWTWPSSYELLLLCMLGAIGLGAHYCMTYALERAGLAILAPLDYINLIWAILIGSFVFGEYPGVSQLIGASIILAVALCVIPNSKPGTL